MPDIQNTFAEVYGPQGLYVGAIDPDSDDYLAPESVAAFVANQGVTFPVTIQETAVTPTYSTIEGIYDGANPYPVDILIGQDGRARLKGLQVDGERLELNWL